LIHFYKRKMLGKLRLYLVLLSLPVLSHGRNPKIAVIGAGIGGTSAAFHLSESLPNAEISVFESGKVGGRLATVQIGGREYESGGSIIHPANRLMTDHLKQCGFEKAGSHEADAFSIVSGGKVVFQDIPGIWSTIKMVLRYGLWSLTKMENYVNTIVENFGTIYAKLDQGDAFVNTGELLDGMSPVSKKGVNSHEMQNLTKISLKGKLMSLSLSDDLISELATIATKVNYGQFLDKMHAFVGTVSLAGVQGGLWRVQGGNYKIPECLLQQSGASRRSAKVERVVSAGDKYQLHWTTNNTEIFDIVVLAAPMTSDKEDLELVLPKPVKFPGKYQRTIAYFVEGTLNNALFGFGEDFVATSNIFFIDDAEPISSISLLTPVDYKETRDTSVPKVYKIFSRDPLSREDFGKFFSHVESHITVDWLAYPDYETFPGLELGDFQIHDNLYYLSNVEWAASAMEMSAIAGKNIANVIKSRFPTEKTVKSTPEHKIEKEEL